MTTYPSKPSEQQISLSLTIAIKGNNPTRSTAPVEMTAPLSTLTVSEDGKSPLQPNAVEDPSSENLDSPAAAADPAAAEPARRSQFVPGVNVFCVENPRKYLVLTLSGEWKMLSESDFRMRLRDEGFTSRNEVDPLLIQIQDGAKVDYVGTLAGRKAGYFEANGKHILVTQSPKLVEPCQGKWETLEAFFGGLLVTGDSKHGEHQLTVFYAWLRGAVDDLRKERRSQAQALVLAGAVGCGKSLLQRIITECLGGRSAKAYRYLTGGSSFNSELAGAEHLMLEDEAVGEAKSHRDKIKAGIKNFTVSTEVQSIHGKGKEAINLPVFWRLSISLNDEPEALRVLPPLDSDVKDKLIILRTMKNALPMPTTTAEEREQFWATLMGELSAFLHWLLTEFDLPAELQDTRYPVKTWQHPQLIEALEEFSDMYTLLALIDEVLWDDPKRKDWDGTEKELHSLLLGDSRSQSRATRLFAGGNTTGTLLAKAAILKPYKIRMRGSKKGKWVIKRPLKRGSSRGPC